MTTNPTPTNQGELKFNWHSLSSEEVIRKLDTALDKGLTDQQAEKRLHEVGENALKETKRTTLLQAVWGQINSFVIWLLLGASLISILLQEWVDAFAILTIVILNTVLGVVQERRAEQALAALKKLAAPEASVLRGGHRVNIPARELVPGDIVFLEAGNFIPADIRLLETANLQIEEAALTGESVPVTKSAASVLEGEAALGDRTNTAFMGTLVTYGRGRGVVISTGMHTQLGLIATMLQSVEAEQTPLQRRLDQLGKTLGIGALIICGLVFVAGVIQGTDLGLLRQGVLPYWQNSGSTIVRYFMVAVSLAIAAVPEGLPTVVTISLALGMREMIKRHALIRRLASVETLGSATVICSDKTGTLTQNEMTVTQIWADGILVEVSGRGYTPEGEFTVDGKPADPSCCQAVRNTLWLGTINNDASLEKFISETGKVSYRIIGDPTEGAIVVAAHKAGHTLEDINRAFPRKDEIPFDSERKRMITLHAILEPEVEDLSPFDGEGDEPKYVVAVKGAPDMLLDLCTFIQAQDGVSARPLTDAERKKILQANDGMTQKALRVLGVAYRPLDQQPASMERENLEKNLIFVGLIGMIDPPRVEVKPALEKARRAGIRTIMITGDYPATARAIADSIGLLQPGHGVLTGTELNDLSDVQLRETVCTTDVFARVSPEHKMRIVDALKANGEVVAMTGDGVNDAPAIKRADIGVAMGITGTDVAKGSADMVLTDDNYVSIVSAVEQGRVIYSNIRKFVYYLVSCNLAEILTIFIPTAFGRWIFPQLVGKENLAPLTAIQLLWLNLVTDGAPALALGTEKGDPDIMEQQPRPAKEPIINRPMWINVIIQTIMLAGVTLVAYGLGLSHAEPEYAETLAFITLSLAQIMRAYSSRSERYPLIKQGIFSNKWMNWAALASVGLVMLVVYLPPLNIVFDTLPMGWNEWRIILPLVIIPTIVGEISKAVLLKRKK